MSDVTEKPQRFWMVAGSGPSMFRHDSRREAEAEAKRLARQCPDQWFYVVAAISAHRKNDVESVRISSDPDSDIPF